MIILLVQDIPLANGFYHVVSA